LEGRQPKSDLIVTDLPGIYSLSPYTNEEVVSRDYLASGEPAAVIDIVDSTNIERNLYLTTQIMELGKPVVMALNMVDALKKSGDKIDAAKLSEKLGCPVIGITTRNFWRVVNPKTDSTVNQYRVVSFSWIFCGRNRSVVSVNAVFAWNESLKSKIFV